LKRTLLAGLVVGVVSFLAGFVGPIILRPDSNQGPLLGIFITGPAGFVLGGVGGFVWSRRGREAKRAVDDRSQWVRRFRDVMSLHLNDLGGPDNCSEAEKAIARRAACLIVELEQMERKDAVQPMRGSILRGASGS
jgi:hypothetical protein